MECLYKSKMGKFTVRESTGPLITSITQVVRPATLLTLTLLSATATSRLRSPTRIIITMRLLRNTPIVGRFRIGYGLQMVNVPWYGILLTTLSHPSEMLIKEMPNIRVWLLFVHVSNSLHVRDQLITLIWVMW